MIKVLFRKLKTAVSQPKWIFIRMLIKVSPLLRDDVYLKMLFPLRAGYKLNLCNPTTFNEKLQWLKINYRRPIMTQMADKYEAKKYTERLIGQEYVVKTYGVWDTFDQIDISKLPDKFVLKTTHDSGGVVICKAKNNFNFNHAKKKLTKHLKTKNYFITREWPYRNIKPRIMAEEFIEDVTKGDLWDYKFFCFDGEVKAMFIATERLLGKEVKFDFFDKHFNSLNIVQQHPNSSKKISKPDCFDEMVVLAERLSKGFPHLRIDFYNIGSQVFFGEYTFYHHGGIVPFHPKTWDYTFGEWINLKE